MLIPRRAALASSAGFVLVAALLSGCGSGESVDPGTPTSGVSASATSPAPEATETVNVEEDGFSPADLTINAGDTVSWHFDNDTAYGVQGIGDKAMSINSPLLEVGDWSHTFTQPGEYRYLCPIHPDMRGTITVEEP